MKVLKPGRKQKDWAKKFECTGDGNGGGGCGALLLVEQGDLLRTGTHDYSGESTYYVSFRCPSCRILTDLPDNAYPGDMWKLKKGPGG